MLFEAVSHSETKQIFKTVNGKKFYSGSEQFLSCLLPVSVDCASFGKTSELARINCFDCQLQTEMEMSAKFYAVLSLSLCMVPILCLFSGPLLYQSLKGSSDFFSSATYSYFSQGKP